MTETEESILPPELRTKRFGPDERRAAIDDILLRMRNALEHAEDWNIRLAPPLRGVMFLSGEIRLRPDARSEPRPINDTLAFREPPLNTLDAFAATSDADAPEAHI